MLPQPQRVDGGQARLLVHPSRLLLQILVTTAQCSHPPAVPRVEAVQVGCGDATHLGRVVSLQWRQQRLADVEVSVLKLALQQMVSKI